MTPLFPDFKSLEPSDRNVIEAYTAPFPPYSDYNFTSLLSWNDGSVAWCVLGANLVIRFAGYLKDQPPFLSFIGSSEVDSTIEALLDLAGASAVGPLRLVPEAVVDRITDPSQYRVGEDPDNHDYVFRTAEIAGCHGPRYASKRNLINRFLREHGPQSRVEDLDLADERVRLRLRDVFRAWEQSRGLRRDFTEEESRALTRFLESSPAPGLIGIGVTIGGRLRAFSICESVDGEFALGHFEKADATYPGLFEYLRQQVAARLREERCKFVNLEQDLGLAGLRQAKQSWRPAMLLKKFVIAAK